MKIEKNGISEVVDQIHITNKQITDQYAKMEGLATVLLEKMSQKTKTGTYDVYAPTLVEEKLDNERYNPYYLGYTDGVFSILQDEDPDFYDNTGEHNFIELNPRQVPAEYLVSIINTLPATLNHLLKKMEKERDRCSKAYELVEKILEAIK